MIPMGMVAVIAVVAGVFLVMLVAAAGKSALPGSSADASAGVARLDARLERIEQVLDHLAQEIELIGEGQQHLSGRLPPRTEDRAR